MSVNWEKTPTPTHTLHTAYPLRKVAWRPERETELAIVPLNQPISSSTDPSISSITAGIEATADEDAHLEIWDVRRHYIAKYALPTSDGTAVDIAWGEDRDSLVACFQSGVMAQMDVRTRVLPLEDVPRQLMAWSAGGEMAYALDRFKAGEIPFDDL
jgi:hypothetical protein